MLSGFVCIPGRGSLVKVEPSDHRVEHGARHVKRIAEDGDEDEDATRCHFKGVKDVKEISDFELMLYISACCLYVFSRCGVLVDQNLKSLDQTLCSCFWYSDTVIQWYSAYTESPNKNVSQYLSHLLNWRLCSLHPPELARVHKSHGMTHRNGLRPLQDNYGGHHLLHHHRHYYQHSHAWGAWEVCVIWCFSCRGTWSRATDAVPMGVGTHTHVCTQYVFFLSYWCTSLIALALKFSCTLWLYMVQYRWPPSLESMNGPQTHEGILGKFFAHICFVIFILFAILLKH